MTWKELKELVEAAGFNDDTKIYYKDMNFGGPDEEFASYDITLDKDKGMILISSKFHEELD